MPPQLTDAADWPVRLGRELASGGEGTIWTLTDRPEQLAKVYHRPLSVDGGDKLRAMIERARPDLTDLAGWPTGLLFVSGLVAGFLMPRFDDFVPIQHLYNPARRRQLFPRADWSFLIRAARSIATSVQAVHRAGCVIADVNQSNVLIGTDGRVALVDCDSFQVAVGERIYACNVGVPHYTASEIQHRDFHGLVRTENHDAFGLAVLVFQLLMQGRHPFAGVWLGDGEMPIERAISEGRFAYGGSASAMQVERPPHVTSLDDLPTEVAALFERAFGRFERRPTPAEWSAALDRMAGELAQCERHGGHRFLASRKQCTWCAIVDAGGPDYFAGTATADHEFALQRPIVDELRSRIEAVPLDSFTFENFQQTPSPAPTPLPPEATRADPWAYSFAAFAVLGLTLALAALPYWRAVCIGLAVCGASAIGHLIRTPRTPYWRERLRRWRELRRAEAALAGLASEWRRMETGLFADALELQTQLRKSLANLNEFDHEYRDELSRRGADRQSLGRRLFLQSQFIADARIPGISARHIRLLAARGVETAFDVEDWRLQSVDGLAERTRKSLLDWKQDLNVRAPAEDPSNLCDDERRAVSQEFRRREMEAIRRTESDIERLETVIDALCSQVRDFRVRQRSLEAERAAAATDYSIFRR